MAPKRQLKSNTGPAFKFQKAGGPGRPLLKSVARSRGALFAGENNYYDSYASGSIQAITTSWAGAENVPATILTLFAPTEGNGIENRSGQKVQVKSLRIRGNIKQPALTAQTVSDSPGIVRLILVMDTQTNAAQVQAETVMTGQSVTSQSWFAFQNTTGIGRFRVLKDKVFALRRDTAVNNASAGTVSSSGTNMPFKFNIKFKKPLIVRFNGTNGGTVADIIDNSFHVLCASDQAGNTIQYSARTTFVG